MNTTKRQENGDTLMVVGFLIGIFGYAGTFASKGWVVLAVLGVVIFMIGAYLQSSNTPKNKQ